MRFCTFKQRDIHIWIIYFHCSPIFEQKHNRHGYQASIIKIHSTSESVSIHFFYLVTKILSLIVSMVQTSLMISSHWVILGGLVLHQFLVIAFLHVINNILVFFQYIVIQTSKIHNSTFPIGITYPRMSLIMLWAFSQKHECWEPVCAN